LACDKERKSVTVQVEKRYKDQSLNGGVMEWRPLEDMRMLSYSVRGVVSLAEVESLDAELLDDWLV
jgi:hypothetical protein